MNFNYNVNCYQFSYFCLIITLLLPYIFEWLLFFIYILLGFFFSLLLYDTIWSICYNSPSIIDTIVSFFNCRKHGKKLFESFKSKFQLNKCNFVNIEDNKNENISHNNVNQGTDDNIPHELKREPLLSIRRIRTGNDKLNRSIETLILVIMKEYIIHYYSSVSKDSENYRLMYEKLISVVQELITMLRPNNWMAFISLKLNYELLFHVRIYLKALEKSNINLLNPQSKLSYKKLLDEFFTVEREHTPKSYYQICCDDTKLYNYFYNLLSMILYHLLPSEDFDNELFRYSLQNIFAQQCVNIINKISEPTFLNKFFVTQMEKYEWFNADSLMASIRFISEPKDLNCLKNVITKYMAKLALNDDTLKNWNKDIILMNELEKVCQIQYDLLKTGTITIKTEEILDMNVNNENDENELPNDNIEVDYFDPQINPNVIHFNAPILSFNYILENNISNSFYQNYLSENKLFNYYNLYLSLKNLLKKYEIQVESTAYKSGLFLLRDPIINNYHQEVETLIKDFKLDRKNEQLSLLDNGFFQELQLIVCEKLIDITRLNKIISIINGVLASNYVYGRFTHSKIYAEMCVSLKILDSSILDNYDTIVKVNSISQGHIPSVKANVDFEFISLNIIKCENQQLNYKSVIVYVVEVVVKRRNVKDTITIYRRYSDFYKFHTQLCSKFSQVKNFGFPQKSKLLGDNKSAEFVNQRKCQLNSYITKLLNFEYCKNNDKFINEMRQFFTNPKWQPSSFLIINNNDEDNFQRSDDNLNYDENISPQPLSNHSSSIMLADNNTLNSTNYKKETSSSFSFTYNSELYDNELITLAKKLNYEFIEEQTLMLFINLVEEIAGLKQFNWIARKWAGGLKQFILVTYGDKFSKFLMDSIDGFFSYDYITSCVNILRDCFVPYIEEDTSDDDISNIKNTFDKESLARLLSILARIHFIGFNPSDAKRFLGEDNITLSVNKFFYMFQWKELNKRLFLVFLEKFLVILFKERSTLNFLNNI